MENKSPQDNQQKPDSFLKKVVGAVSSDENFIEPPKKNTGKKRKPLTRKGIIRRMIAGTVTFVIIILMLIIYIVLNPQDAVFLNDIFGIQYNVIEATLEYLIYIFFGGICATTGAIFAFFLYKAVVIKTVSWKKRVFSWIMSVFTAIVFFASIGTFAAVYFMFKEIDFTNLSRSIVLYHNDVYLFQEKENKAAARISNLSNMVGPVTIRYDVSSYIDKLKDREGLSEFEGYTFEIDFNGDGKTDATGGTEIGLGITNDEAAVLLHRISEVGTHMARGTIYGTSVTGDALELPLEFPELTFDSVVDVYSTFHDSGGLNYSFDGRALRDLGSVNWYIESEGRKSKFSGFTFSPDKVFTDTDAICLDRYEGLDDESPNCDWVYVIRDAREPNILGELSVFEDPVDPFSYRFELVGLDVKNGEINKDDITWFINNKKYIGNFEAANREVFKYTFRDGGLYSIRAEVKDNFDNFRVFTTQIDIEKVVELKEDFHVQVFDEDGEDLTEFSYDEETDRYIIPNVPTSADLVFDASRVRTVSTRYQRIKTQWDFEDDGIFEEEGNKFTKTFHKEGVQNVVVRYTFEIINENGEKQIVERDEVISLELSKTPIVIRLHVDQPQIYAPSTVTFDATGTKFDGGEIRKFIYDFGDGKVVEGEGVITYVYDNAGEYEASVTAVKSDGTKATKDVTVVVKAAQSFATMNTSISSGRITAGKPVTFDSFGSGGDIESVSWDFGDGFSTIRGEKVVHAFRDPGVYQVTLTVRFTSGVVDTETRVFEVGE